VEAMKCHAMTRAIARSSGVTIGRASEGAKAARERANARATRLGRRATQTSSMESSSSRTRASAKDEVYRVMSANQEVAIVSVIGTAIAKEAATRHRTAPTATAALGRTLMCALLLGTFKGESETTQLTFKGDGPIGQCIAIATHDGKVKGLVSNPSADPPLRNDGKLNVGAAIGRGVLTVSRAHPSMKKPFTGTVEIRTGEIAEDVAGYLQESEQVGSAIAVGVSINRDCEVIAAGGFMVQILPFASEETIRVLERVIPSLPSSTALVSEGLTARQIAQRVLAELDERVELATSITPSYGPCEEAELRERMLRAVASLGKAEVDQILAEDGQIEITCEFCKTTNVLSEGDLAAAQAELARR